MRIAFGGSFFTSEQWSCTLKMTDGDYVTDSAINAFCADHVGDVATAVKTWFVRDGSGLHQQARLEWVKCNAVGADGKYLSQVSNTAAVSPIASPGSFTGATGQLPPNVALVVSLRTGLRAGVGAFGRVYIPPCGLITGVSPKITTPHATTIATNFRDFLVDLNDWPGVDPGGIHPKVAVVSQETWFKDTTTQKTAPQTREVTEVRVGNVLDTQRSRREQLREEYVAVEL